MQIENHVKYMNILRRGEQLRVRLGEWDVNNDSEMPEDILAPEQKTVKFITSRFPLGPGPPWAASKASAASLAACC